jgi:hypothetical protein
MGIVEEQTLGNQTKNQLPGCDLEVIKKSFKRERAKTLLMT